MNKQFLTFGDKVDDSENCSKTIPAKVNRLAGRLGVRKPANFTKVYCECYTGQFSCVIFLLCFFLLTTECEQ